MVAHGPEWVSTSEMLQRLSAKISRASQHQGVWARAQGLILVLGMPQPALPAPWAVPAAGFGGERLCNQTCVAA